MQSMSGMFRLPWSTEPQPLELCEKMQLAKSRPLQPVASFKRKRTDSLEAGDLAQKKSKLAREVQPGVVNSSVTKPQPPVKADQKKFVIEHGKVKLSPAPSATVAQDVASASTPSQPSPKVQPVAEDMVDTQTSLDTDMDTYLTPLQQTIEAQFSLEILFKHQELRLIEQELAKAQIALEQLRRCQIIPFPSSAGMTENVSLGAGPALRPAPGQSRPSNPAPWGVADGPYTKHYAKWLIPDAKFDSVPISSLSNSIEGRSTRASFDPQTGTKSRTSRNSTLGLNLPSLGEPAKEVKIDPLLHKRSTDGQWVRLYCPSCGHSNFSNTQGFLNHCRIKHQQVFKSHDAAAIALGVPVDIDEAGAAIPPQSAPMTSTPLATPISATAPTPTAASSLASSTLVHALIRSDPAQPAKPLPPRRAVEPAPIELPRANGPIKSVAALMTPNLTPGVKRHDYFSTPVSASPVSKMSHGSSFIPSPQTPYINGLFEKHGLSGNLKDVVATAKSKVDLSAMEAPSDDELSPGPRSPNKKTPESQQMARLPSRGGMGPASQRPASKKAQSSESIRGPAHRAPTALNLSATPSLGNSDSRVIPESPVELSPHTLESNPGLVSDDDDVTDEDDNCSVSHLDRDVDMGHTHHPIVVDDGSDAECERRKGLEEFKKAGSSQKQ